MVKNSNAPITSLGQWIGYYGTLYVVLMIAASIAYWLGHSVLQAALSNVFPINPHNSLLKTLSLVTLLYWVAIFIYQWSTLQTLVIRKPPDTPKF